MSVAFIICCEFIFFSSLLKHFFNSPFNHLHWRKSSAFYIKITKARTTNFGVFLGKGLIDVSFFFFFFPCGTAMKTIIQDNTVGKNVQEQEYNYLA